MEDFNNTENINLETVSYEDFVNRIDASRNAGLMTEDEALVAKNRAYLIIHNRNTYKATLDAFMNSDEVSDETKKYNKLAGYINSYILNDYVLENTRIGQFRNILYDTDDKKSNGHLFEIGNWGYNGKKFNDDIFVALSDLGYDDYTKLSNLGIHRVDKGWKVDNNFAALSIFAEAYSNVWNNMGFLRRFVSDSAHSLEKDFQEYQARFVNNALGANLYNTVLSDHNILLALNADKKYINSKANELLKTDGYDVEQDNALISLYQTDLGTLEVQLNRQNGAYKSDTDYKRDIDITTDNFWAFFDNASTTNYKMYAYGGDDISENIKKLNENNILDNLSEVTLDQNKRFITNIIREELNQVDREKNTSRLHASFGMSGGLWGHIISVDAAPETDTHKGHQSFKIFIPYDENGNSPENNIVTKFITRPENMAIQNIADLTSKNNSKIRKGVDFGAKSLYGNYRYLGKNDYGVQLYEFNSYIPNIIYKGNINTREIKSITVTKDQLTRYLSACYLYDQNANIYAYYYKNNNKLLPNGKNAYDAYLDNLNHADELGYKFADYIHMFTGQDVNVIQKSLEDDFKLRSR